MAVDYRYVNRFTRNDAYPLPDILSVLHVLAIIPDNNYYRLQSRLLAIRIPGGRQDWLTAFVYDFGLFEFNRVPFGLMCSGNSFVRAITNIWRPIREFTDSFVDVVAVYSKQWQGHLERLAQILQTVKKLVITLNLKKNVHEHKVRSNSVVRLSVLGRGLQTQKR